MGTRNAATVVSGVVAVSAFIGFATVAEALVPGRADRGTAVAASTFPILLLVQHNADVPKELVELVQGQLEMLGLYAGPIDGVAGPGTWEAINAFNARAGFTPGSFFSPQHHDRLDATLKLLATRDITVEEAIMSSADLLAAQDLHEAIAAAFDRNEIVEVVDLSRGLADRLERVLGAEDPTVLLVKAALVLVLISTGEYREAEDLARYLLEIYPSAHGEPNPKRVELEGAIGLSMMASGRTLEAEAHYRRSLETYAQELGDVDLATMDARYRLAKILGTKGSWSEAETLMRQLLENYETVFGAEDSGTLEIRLELASVIEAQGRFGEAEVITRQVVAVHERVHGADSPEAADVRRRLLGAENDQELLAEDEDLLREELAEYEAMYGKDSPDAFSNGLELAKLIAKQGRYAEAEQLLRGLVERQQRVVGADSLILLELARTVEKQGRLEEAEELFRRVYKLRDAEFEFDSMGAMIALYDQAVSFYKQGRPAEAEPLFRRLLVGQESALGRAHTLTLTTRFLLSVVQWELNMREAAIATFDAGFRSLPEFYAADTGSTITQRKAELPLRIELYFGFNMRSDAPEAVKARRTFEAQGWYTFEQLDVSLADLGARSAFETHAETRALRDLQQARQELRDVRKGYLDSFEDPEATPAGRNLLVGKLVDAEARLGSVVAQVRRDFPALVEIQLPSPLTVEEAQALLGPREGLLAFAQTESVLHAWLVTTDQVEWKQIERSADELSDRVTHLRAALDVSVDPPAKKPSKVCALPASVSGLEDRPFDRCKAEAMYRILLGQFDLSGLDELIVVPDGPLEQLPFSLLVTQTDPDGTPHWLIEDVSISYLPTTSSLRALRQAGIAREAVAEKLPYLGIAPVTFGDQAAAPGMRGGQYDLPSTAAEVERISELLDPGNTVTITGDMASESFARTANLARYKVISFATHALLSEETTLLTDGAITEPALLLHPGEGEDGFLTASEAATLRLDADWVLLSACNTAAGDAEDAEGLSGLARAFFFAGAKALMVSHWPVEDTSAMALMTETMKHSATGDMSRAQALREAMLSVMNDPEHDHGHPLFWAPFVVVGESRM